MAEVTYIAVFKTTNEKGDGKINYLGSLPCLFRNYKGNI